MTYVILKRSRRKIFFDSQGGKCAICGSTENLEADHINPTTKVERLKPRGSRSMWTFSNKEFDEEIRKCQALCRRCHRKKTNQYISDLSLIKRPATHGDHRLWRRKLCRCELCHKAFLVWNNRFKHRHRLAHPIRSVVATESDVEVRVTDFSPKEIVIEECRAQIACMLNELWHSRLPVIHWSNVVRNTHYVCYVFKYKQALIGVGIWSSPVAQNRMKNGKTILELRRLALSDVCPKNTATRVIAEMVNRIRVKFPELTKLVSYQDTDVHKGTIYKAANWTMAGGVPLLDWSTGKRKRSALQSDATKVRWEYRLKSDVVS